MNVNQSAVVAQEPAIKESSDEDLLALAERLTGMMREHQQAVARLSTRRREVMACLKSDRQVSVSSIAKRIGVSDQAVFQDLRKMASREQ